MTTLAEMITLVQVYLGDYPNPGTYTSEFLTPLLNLQQKSLARKIAGYIPEYFEVEQEIQFISGTQEYTLNSEPYCIRYVEIYEEGATIPIYTIKNFTDSRNKRSTKTSTGIPRDAYLSRDKIGFMPIPQGGVAKVVCVILPEDMSVKVNMGLPNICKDVLALRTATVVKAGIMSEPAEGLATILTMSEKELFEQIGTRTESEQLIPSTDYMYYGEA